MPRRLSHLVGFDDGPFSPEHRGDVALIGAVFSGSSLVGVLSGRIRRDGANATRVIGNLVQTSPFHPQLHGVLLQGIAFGGFNVVDIRALHRNLGLPVLVVMRHLPDLAAIEHALLDSVPGGRRKWRLIQWAGPPEAAAGVYVQRAGIELFEAERLIERLALHGLIPEPLRTAHLIATSMPVRGVAPAGGGRRLS